MADLPDLTRTAQKAAISAARTSSWTLWLVAATFVAAVIAAVLSYSQGQSLAEINESLVELGERIEAINPPASTQ